MNERNGCSNTKAHLRDIIGVAVNWAIFDESLNRRTIDRMSPTCSIAGILLRGVGNRTEIAAMTNKLTHRIVVRRLQSFRWQIMALAGDTRSTEM